jgi:3-oxoadipate enol-lactonase
MRSVLANGIHHHVRIDRPDQNRVLMLANSLGTDMRVWDPLIALLPDDIKIVRYDKRGHGLTDCPSPPYAMEDLVSDAAGIADALELRGVTFVGLSIGGLIGQGLALTRPDIVGALILMDTAARIGQEQMWQERIEAVRKQGMGEMAGSILARWFTPEFVANKDRSAPWKNMLSNTLSDGYIGCCQAIAGADYTGRTEDISAPVLALAGDHDLSTPPDLVQQTAARYNAPFYLIRNAGHLPCVEQPEAVADLIISFIEG